MAVATTTTEPEATTETTEAMGDMITPAIPATETMVNPPERAVPVLNCYCGLGSLLTRCVSFIYKFFVLISGHLLCLDVSRLC